MPSSLRQPFVGMRRSFDAVRGQSIMLLIGVVVYAVIVPVVVWLATEASPRDFTGFVDPAPEVGNLVAAGAVLAGAVLSVVSLRGAKRLYALDALAEDPAIDGDAALAKRLARGVVMQSVASDAIGLLAVIVYLVRGGIFLPIGLIVVALALLAYSVPRWSHWSELRSALRERRPAWVAEDHT